MFKNCIAFTIASEAEWRGRLSAVLQQIGFRQSIRLNAAESLMPADHTRLHFLLMHSSMNRDLIHKITQFVRSSADENIRFMPIVVLLDASLESEVQEFLQLGCDDIIIYPCSAKTITQRLVQQVNTQRDYFQTDNYFGPDRRQLGMNEDHPERRGGKESSFRHMVISRAITGKIEIVSDTQHTPLQKTMAG